jgi:hypothetical protein
MDKIIKNEFEFGIKFLIITISLNPILNQLSKLNFEIFGFDISISFLYYIFLGLLTFCMYIFSLAITSHKSIYQIIGNRLLIIILRLPLFFTVAWAISKIYTVLLRIQV